MLNSQNVAKKQQPAHKKNQFLRLPPRRGPTAVADTLAVPPLPRRPKAEAPAAAVAAKIVMYENVPGNLISLEIQYPSTLGRRYPYGTR